MPAQKGSIKPGIGYDYGLDVFPRITQILRDFIRWTEHSRNEAFCNPLDAPGLHTSPAQA